MTHKCCLFALTAHTNVVTALKWGGEGLIYTASRDTTFPADRRSLISRPEATPMQAHTSAENAATEPAGLLIQRVASRVSEA